MLDFIYQTYIHYIYSPFFSLIRHFEGKPAGIYVLVVVFIVLSIVQAKFKKINSSQTSLKAASNQKSAKQQAIASRKTLFVVTYKVVNLLTLIVILLIIGVCWIRFGPAVTKFFKESNTTKTPSSTTNSTTPTTPTQQTTPTTQTTKRLYYSCNCSSCWKEGCPHNGFNYAGYDEYSYLYYKSLCQACSCNSFNARSFWR